MIVAPSEIDAGTYFIFRPLVGGNYKEVKFVVKDNMVVGAKSDKLYNDEMQWIRNNIFIGAFNKLQDQLKELNHVEKKQVQVG